MNPAGTSQHLGADHQLLSAPYSQGGTVIQPAPTMTMDGQSYGVGHGMTGVAGPGFSGQSLGAQTIGAQGDMGQGITGHTHGVGGHGVPAHMAGVQAGFGAQGAGAPGFGAQGVGVPGLGAQDVGAPGFGAHGGVGAPGFGAQTVAGVDTLGGFQHGMVGQGYQGGMLGQPGSQGMPAGFNTGAINGGVQMATQGGSGEVTQPLYPTTPQGRGTQAMYNPGLLPVTPIAGSGMRTVLSGPNTPGTAIPHPMMMSTPLAGGVGKCSGLLVD